MKNIIIFKEIQINAVDNLYVETKGLDSYISKEIRVTIGNHQPENYVDVIKYIIDYIVDSKPIISENQNIGYYSWLLQFRLDEYSCYDLYEASSTAVALIKVVIRQFRWLGNKVKFVGNKILFLFFQTSTSQWLYQMVFMKERILKASDMSRLRMRLDGTLSQMIIMMILSH